MFTCGPRPTPIHSHSPAPWRPCGLMELQSGFSLEPLTYVITNVPNVVHAQVMILMMEPDLVVWSQKTWKCSPCLSLAICPFHLCSGKTRKPLTVYQKSSYSILANSTLSYPYVSFETERWYPGNPLSFSAYLTSLSVLLVCLFVQRCDHLFSIHF